MPKPPPARRRCVLCGYLTHNWQRIGGGEWHCYDQCQSTLGTPPEVERSPHTRRLARLTKRDVSVLKGGKK